VSRLFLLLIALLLLFTGSATAQSSKSDSLMNIPMIYATGGYDFAGGDIKDRFGNNFELGAGFLYKTKNNWLFGLEFNFLTGGKVKENTLDSILTEDGFLIGEDGLIADVRISERGIKLPVLKVGKLISAPIGKASVNSGFMFLAGIGFMQHKINYYDVTGSAPQIRGEYEKGYDRLTNGLALTQNIGYLYINRNNHANFFVNLEFTEAFTQNRRELNFNTRTKDTQSRVDLLYGVKVGWIFPVYKKKPAEFYYN
jgi:hypothetical protein